MTNNNYAQRLAALTPQQRATLLQQLKKQQAPRQPLDASITPLSRTQASFPLSFAQERLWFLDQLEPESPLYNIPQVLRLRGPLDLPSLQAAINALVARHETLRTHFSASEGTPQQSIASPPTLPIQRIDLTTLLTDERENVALELVQEEVGRAFQLASWPLLRVTVLQLTAQEHFLVIVIHHIIADGWSSGVLFQELFTLFEGFASGRPAQLPPLAVQYVDFAHWQREQLRGEKLERLLSYWRQQLEQIPMLQLPFDHPRLAEQSFRGGVEFFTLSEGLTNQLRALAQRENCTLFMTLLAAFKALLFRYTGQAEISVGSLIANRTRTELEHLIGFFVNTLVLHTTVAGSLSFRELLSRVREVCFGAYAHQDLPFERLVEELQPERSLSYSPLFQVLFTLQNAPATALGLAGLEISTLDLGPTNAKFDLSFFAAEQAREIGIEVEYNRDLFEPETIQGLLRHFEVLLTGCVTSPDQAIGQLALLAPAERDSLLQTWNATARDYPWQSCLHELFASQAATTPDRIAASFDEQALTYQELDRRSTLLATYLQKQLGIGPEARVGLLMERSLDLMIGLLGILKAGGAYLPLDPDYPVARLSLVLEDAQIAILLTQSHLLNRLPSPDLRPLCLDTDWPEIASVDLSSGLAAVHACNLAYVIYTSGSTGRPKGVQISHRTVVNFLTSMREQPGLDETETLLAVTSLSFDIAALEIYLPLLVGARVAVAGREIARDGERLALALTEQSATVMQATPSTWRLLLESGWQGSPSLRILCGGEALPADLAQNLVTKGQELWNLYGPTETTIWSAIQRVTQVEGSVALGYPIANTQLYILDAYQEPVPIGVPGELSIGGLGLSRGYLHQPALTAERFVPDPFSRIPGRLLYRTGDLATYQRDGTVKFLGRLDQQVKLHGFRIELGEIEYVLNRHPAVRECVVTVRTDATANPRLVAYIVPERLDARAPADGSQSLEQVSHWQLVWDTTYTTDEPPSDASFNLSGWKSSYTKEALPAAEMREWVAATVERLRAHKAQSILEIGCGTGLLLFQLAPESREYCGTDFSASVLAQVQAQVTRQDLSRVQLLQREACDFTDIPPASYDLVILNSVVQYFPSVDYLLRVLEGAIQVLKPGGQIFLGDIRNFELLKLFHTTIQFHEGAATLATSELRQRIQTRTTQEEELTLDPSLFMALQQHLPRIKRVEIQLKRGRAQNELTRFRYDVTLQLEEAARPALHVQRRDWSQNPWTLPELHDYLQNTAPEALILSGVPNARLTKPAQLAQLVASEEAPATLGQLRAILDNEEPALPGFEPEVFWELGRHLSYKVEIAWSRTHGPLYYDVTLSQPGLAIPLAELEDQSGQDKRWHTYANQPLALMALKQLAPTLRTYAQEQLPAYMLPATFLFLPALPLTPNGKIDRQALPAPEQGRSAVREAYAGPRTALEKTLAEVWSETLDIEDIGVHDNFFELGGNSLLVIRMVARARKAGVLLTTKQLFLHQTIAKLAAAGGITTILAEQGVSSGLTPAIPGQRYVLAPGVQHPEYFNLAYFIFAQEHLDFQHVRTTVKALLTYHDALRLQRAPADAPLPLLIAEPALEVPCWSLDVTRLTRDEVNTTFTLIMEQLHTSINLTQGPLFKVVLFDRGPTQASVVLLLGHYLVADIESWQIVLEDFLAAYQLAASGKPVVFPTKGSSFKQWAERLQSYAQTSEATRELPYWQAEARWKTSLPLDYPGGANTISSSGNIEVELSAAETSQLLSEVLKRYRTQMDAILLMAIARICTRWAKRQTLLVRLFTHGRASLFEDLDISRTVGAFGTDFPLLLDLSETHTEEETLRQVTRQLAEVPAHGFGYGVLRALSHDVQAKKLAAMPEAEIVVNYIGEAGNAPTHSAARTFGPYSGHYHDTETDRGYTLQITGRIVEGQLRLQWDYSQNLHRPSTIEALAASVIQDLQALIARCASAPSPEEHSRS